MYHDCSGINETTPEAHFHLDLSQGIDHKAKDDCKCIKVN